jgi:hypothetical protein
MRSKADYIGGIGSSFTCRLDERKGGRHGCIRTALDNSPRRGASGLAGVVRERQPRDSIALHQNQIR